MSVISLVRYYDYLAMALGTLATSIPDVHTGACRSPYMYYET